MTPTMLLIAGALLAAIVLVYVLTRAVATRKERCQHVACPGCMCKLRYFRRQTGHAVTCPQCTRRFNLPGSVAKSRARPRA